MKISAEGPLKFDSFFPLYNWIFPGSGHRVAGHTVADAEIMLSTFVDDRVVSRAIYVHTPFCETVCSFCPFVRGRYKSEELIEAYVRALIKEIEVRAKYYNSVPIGAIFFGGGTPSLLSPKQVRSICSALRRTFDLSKLREWSFEFEVKSVNEELLATLQECGVTHARFGVQTFVERYRKAFNLTSTIDQVHKAAEDLPQYFRFVSCDMIYGMSGSNEEDLQYDVDKVCSLKLSNVDYYPINNLMTQRGLHENFSANNWNVPSALSKFYMTQFVDACLNEKGYTRHNGHGYVRGKANCPERAYPGDYKFEYHDHVYGYADTDVVGFGANAISSGRRFTVQNDASRSSYIRDLTSGDVPKISVTRHSPAVWATKPISARLPYHGAIDVPRVWWDDVPTETIDALSRSEEAGLVTRAEGKVILTREGSRWYSNLMFYLSANEEKASLIKYVTDAQKRPWLQPEELAASWS